MDSSRFDELTKALATSTTRRKALGRIGGTLAGSVLAAWPFTQALAAGGGNSACAHFCAEVFGADTPAAKQCTSEAAHGGGLCYQCGTATASSICCTRNSRGYCSSSSNAQCPCESSQCLTCDSTTGTCVGCPQGQTCQGGTCATYGYVSVCGCSDGSTKNLCTPTCDNDSIIGECQQVCSNNGGFDRTLKACYGTCILS